MEKYFQLLKSYHLSLSVFAAGIIIGGAVLADKIPNLSFSFESIGKTDKVLQAAVLPTEGNLGIKWGDMGKKMIEAGVIDSEKFEALYEGRGGMSEKEKQLLYGSDNGSLEITEDNAQFILNLLWAFGLANSNSILTEGPMSDPKYGGAHVFASTAGWTLAKTDSMEHYSMHKLVPLTSDQQSLVEKVSNGIYRPCCNNSTFFPDCNHGMAQLGLLELLAASGATEEEMYEKALLANQFWFPDTYVTIAKFLALKGIDYNVTDPKELLGSNFSSASGYRNILNEVTPVKKSQNSCGV